MDTAIFLTHAAELWTKDGPTGRHVEVLRGKVTDYGGAVLFEGSPDKCVAKCRQWKTPTRLVPTEWRKVDGEVAGASHDWQMVVE